MKYEILIDYTTGDSFGSEERNDQDLGLIFDNVQLAEQALKDIEEHYKLAEEYDRAWNDRYVRSGGTSGRRFKSEVLKDVVDKAWCTAQDKDYWQFAISLETSEGIRTQIHVFYVGYFETLRCARAVPMGENKLEIRFH